MDAIKRILILLLICRGGLLYSQPLAFEVTKQIVLPPTETMLYSFDVVSDYLCLVPLDGKIVSPIHKILVNNNPVHYYHSTKVFPIGDYQYVTFFNKLTKQNYVAQYKGKQKIFEFPLGKSGIYRLAPVVDSTFCVAVGFDKGGYNFTVASKAGVKRYPLQGSLNALIPVSEQQGFLAINNKILLYALKDEHISVKKVKECPAEIFDMELWDESRLIVSMMDGTYLFSLTDNKLIKLVDEFGALKVLNEKLYVLNKKNIINVYSIAKK